MPKPLDQAKRAAIEQDIREGTKSRNAIARAHNVSGSTVGKLAEKLRASGELDAPAFDRSNTKKATEAVMADAAALRANLANGAYRMAETVLASFETVNWEKVAPYSRAVVFGILVERATDLARADDGAEQQAASLLEALVGDIRAQRAAVAAVPDAAE